MSLNPIHPSVEPHLDPLFIRYYNDNFADKPATHQIPLEEVRKSPQRWARSWSVNAGLSNNPRVRDWTVSLADGEEIQVRVYSPDKVSMNPGPYAVHVNFHGGGWVFGDLSSDAAICLRLTNRLPIVVVDVGYRLCPEYPFGTNVRDAWAALLWVRQDFTPPYTDWALIKMQVRENASALNVIPTSLSVGGISAGAHLACILTHLARDACVPLRLLIAAIPPLADHHRYTSHRDSPWPSFSQMKDAPMLGWRRMEYLSTTAFSRRNGGLDEEEVPEWWISPLKASNFAGLCDAFIATAECDPLRDEGEGYARKLAEAGNRVTMRRYLKVPHSFMHMVPVLPQAVKYEDDVVEALLNAHGLRPL